MKTLSKLFCLLLALTMVLSLAMPAMAEETDPEPQSEPEYSITITDKYDNHIYEAYQIFSGDYKDGILANIRWGTGFQADKVADFLAALNSHAAFGGKFNGIAADSDIPAEIANVLANNTGFVRDFAKILHTQAEDGTYLYLSDTCLTSTESADGTNFKYTFANVEAGYYLIKDQDNSIPVDGYDYYTRLMVQVVGAVNINPKGDVPKVEKKVHLDKDGTFEEFEDVSLTDTFYFKITGTLPSNLSDYESYEYEFVDQLPAGMDLDTDTVVSQLDEFPGMVEILVDHANTTSDAHFTLTTNRDNASNDPTSANRFNLLLAKSEADIIEGETDILITYDAQSRVLRIKFLDLRKSMPNLVTTDAIVIKYAAKLNSNAILGNGNGGTGNVNTVYLNFSNNPQADGTGRTPESDAKVFTYRLNVKKVGENSTPLADAEFLLYQRMLDSSNNVAYKYAVFESVDENGTYRIKDWIILNTPVAGEARDQKDYQQGDPNYALDVDKNVIYAGSNPVILGDSTIISPEGDGIIKIIGLESKDYWLAELNAPLPYNVIKEPIPVSIRASHDDTTGAITELEVSADGTLGVADKTSGEGTITVQNNKGNVLPSTGGIGTTIFYVAGGLLAAAAIILLITKKRMSDK